MGATRESATPPLNKRHLLVLNEVIAHKNAVTSHDVYLSILEQMRAQAFRPTPGFMTDEMRKLTDAKVLASLMSLSCYGFLDCRDCGSAYNSQKIHKFSLNKSKVKIISSATAKKPTLVLMSENENGNLAFTVFANGVTPHIIEKVLRQIGTAFQ